MKGRRNQRCKIRFDSLVKAEKGARREKGPEVPEAGEAPVPEAPVEGKSLGFPWLWLGIPTGGVIRWNSS